MSFYNSYKISFEVHYASAIPIHVSFSKMSPIVDLMNAIKEQYNIRDPVLFVWNASKMKYQEITNDKEYKACAEGKRVSREQVYIAEGEAHNGIIESSSLTNI
jgi:hypothetical protein